MAITSLDGIIANATPPVDFMKIGATAEAIGVLHSTILTAGMPGAAAAANTRTLAAPGALTSYAGSVPIPAAVGGENIHLIGWEMTQAAGYGGFQLLDRQVQVDTLTGGIVVTTTTAQNITFPTPPSRDANGAALGVQVMAAIEVQTATTNAGAIAGGPATGVRIGYTNSAGTAGRVGYIPSFPATAVAGTFLPFTLDSGDLGIRSIQSITLGTSLVTGTVSLLTYRQIASIGTPLANTLYTRDAIALGMPRVYDNSCLFVVGIPTATTLGVADGSLSFTQG